MIMVIIAGGSNVIFLNHSGIFQNFTMNFYIYQKKNKTFEIREIYKCYLREQSYKGEVLRQQG